jgi:hypothetical protein
MRALRKAKQQFLKAIDQIHLFRFYRKHFEAQSIKINLIPLPVGSIDLVVVAFNRPDMIEYQHIFLQKNFKNAFHYTIADNSNQPEAREALRTYCQENNLTYLSLPTNPFHAPRYSDSHGAALNYVWRNYLKYRKASYIGILDHDIFPIEPIDLKETLSNQDFYGMLQVYDNAELKDGKLMYLWPGLAMINQYFLANTKVNFMPKLNGDTGSAMHDAYCQSIRKSTKEGRLLDFAEEERIKLLEGNDFQTDMFALIGKKWLHVVNAAAWKIGNKDKDEKIKDLIERLIQGESL